MPRQHVELGGLKSSRERQATQQPPHLLSRERMDTQGHQLPLVGRIDFANRTVRDPGGAELRLHREQLVFRARVKRNRVGVFRKLDAADRLTGGMDHLRELHAHRQVPAYQDVVPEGRSYFSNGGMGLRSRNGARSFWQA